MTALPSPQPRSEGGDLHMTQFFRGNLAGLTIRSGKLADKKVIDCLYTCKEGLELHLPEDSGRGVKVTASNLPAEHSPARHPRLLDHKSNGCWHRAGL